MLVQPRLEHIGVYDFKPMASVPRPIRRLIRFCRKRLPELAVGGLLVVWWLQVFGLWVGFLQEASLLDWPR